MKKTILFSLFFVTVSMLAQAQAEANWTKDQLMEPATLARELAAGKKLPLIFSVGPGASIPHSIAIGMTNDEGNLNAFKAKLKDQPKDAPVVIYCGCCPFEHCPNVRPAIEALKAQHFTNYKLLNLSHNLKTDWIDKGYPTTPK